MACSCSTKKVYVVTKPDGTTVERRTETEARALAIRSGGTYRVKS